jgi:hypothetical protein
MLMMGMLVLVLRMIRDFLFLRCTAVREKVGLG